MSISAYVCVCMCTHTGAYNRDFSTPLTDRVGGEDKERKKE